MWKLTVFISLSLAFAKGDTQGPDIVGGTKTTIEMRPFQVSVEEVPGFNYHFCGGSIINEYWIVTAAHCLSEFSNQVAGWLFAAVGGTDKRYPEQKITFSKLVVHEKYDPDDSYRNDIALAKLTRPFKFDDKVKPVPLPKKDSTVPVNSSVVLSGWGKTLDNDNPSILREVTLMAVDQQKCKDIIEGLSSKNHIYKTNLCAYDPNERRGQCSKDSGGPLTLDGTLVGIVSWSYKDPTCGSTTKPAIYTRVSEYVDWINSHISE